MSFKTLLVTLSLTAAADARPWGDDVMYFMMTDRFCDEDSANNIPTGIDPTLYDPKQKDISLYYGTEFSLLDAGVKSVKMEELAA